MGVVYPFPETDEVIYMKRAAEKLKSSRGASLMMALLLFLVCAVVGSAVLTAGTAASGRMAKIAESDQRYYSVNSAANLLIDLFKDPVKITETVKKDASTGNVTTTYKINDAAYPPSAINSFPVETACRIIERNMAGSSANISLTVTLPAPGPTVEIAETIFTDDRVEFVVTSASAVPTTEKYELHLVFKADKTENRTVKVTDTETTTTTETSITWKLSGVK